MTTTWIDFRELRAQLRIADVLKHFKVEMKVRGDRASGFCPLPGHQSRREAAGEGKRRSPSFSVHLGKGVFQCFSCGAKGNVLDLVCLLLGLNPDDPSQLRKGALQARETFGMTSANRSARTKDVERTVVDAPAKTAVEDAPPDVPVVINAPLDFELKQLDPKHPYLTGRGFTPATIAHFGLGYCGKGMMAGRIAIPVHDRGATVVGYAGRLIDDSAITDENPKYRFPSARVRDGKRYEFHKSLLLYNAHRLVEPLTDLIVVEGFASVWWLWQHGYPNVVAIMGSDCSDEQATIVCDLLPDDSRVWVFSDGDPPGDRCAASVLTKIAPCRLTGWIQLRENRQPTDCDAETLDVLLQPLRAAKSGTSASLTVAKPGSTSNGKAAEPTAA
jgi:DNA primase